MAALHIIAKQGGITREDEADFGVDPDVAAVRLHRAENIVFKPAQNMIPVNAQKTGDMLGAEPFIVGGLGGELTFDLPLHTVSGFESPTVSLLQACGGKLISVAAGVGLVTGGAAATMQMLTASLGNIAVGCGIMHNSALGVDSLRFVERVQPATPGALDTTIHMSQSFGAVPAAGDSWTAVDTIVPSSDLPTWQSFHVFAGSGATDILEYVLSGCSGIAVIKPTEAGALPMVTFTFTVGNWSVSAATLAQTAFAGNEAAPLLGDSFYMDGVAVATKSLGFNMGLEMIPLAATSGSQGREGFKHINSVAKLEILPRHDITLITKWQAGTIFDAMFVSMQSLTNAWGLWIPAAQILSYENGDVDGLLRPTMDIQATDLGVTTELTQIPQWAIAITK